MNNYIFWKLKSGTILGHFLQIDGSKWFKNIILLIENILSFIYKSYCMSNLSFKGLFKPITRYFSLHFDNKFWTEEFCYRTFFLKIFLIIEFLILDHKPWNFLQPQKDSLFSAQCHWNDTRNCSEALSWNNSRFRHRFMSS